MSWIRNGSLIGSGHANAVVNPLKTNSLSTASIKAATSMGIEGKVALVTGASRGIGEATAKLLAIHGAKTVVHYFRGKDDASDIVSDIKKNGGHAMSVGGDLRSAIDITNMFEEITAQFGGVDILVNNAVSQFSPKPLTTITSKDYLEEFKVSLFGMHECCQLAIPHMQKKRWGKIINIGTITTEAPVSGQNVYITTKAAILGYTRSLCAELGRYNIQANLVIPRMTDTSLLASLPPSFLDKLANESLAGRLLEPIEVAKVIVFFASEWSSPISGQRIALNQGEMPFL